MISTKIQNFEGHYGSGNWAQLGDDQLQCTGGYLCTNDLVEFTNPNATDSALDPCMVINTCTGTVQVIVEDSIGNPLENLLVTRDDASNKTTDEVGTATYNLTKTCGQDLEFVVKCSDNATYCGTKSTALDFIGDFDSLSFDCTVCTGASDLIVDLGSVEVDYQSGSTYSVKVNITIAGSMSLSSLNVTVKGQHKDTGLIERENSVLVDISSSDRNKLATVNLDTTNINYFHIYVDPQNKAGDWRVNNYVLYPFVKEKVKAYLDVDTGIDVANTVIENYLKAFVDEQPSQATADITICVGRKCSLFNSLNSYTLNNWQKNENFGYKNNKIIFNGKGVGTNRPYNAIVGGFWKATDGKRYVMAYGIDIEGDVAAVKKLISARELFLSDSLSFEERTKVIDDYDLTGISVMDLMHNAENRNYYAQNNDNFGNVITKILNDNNFEIAIKRVRTYNDNTTLRMKNVNSDFSDNYKDAIVNNTKPVVLSRGIHSNLLTWQDFARDLASDPENARDTWLIEMVGGPTIDEQCDKYDCPDYTFTDLKTYYWPALIAGVEQYSGQNTIDYVGYSLGCSAALESLELYGSSGKNDAGYYFDSDTGNYVLTDLAANPVDTFVAVACPGNFTELTTLIEIFNMTKDDVFSQYNTLDIDHVTGGRNRQLTTLFKYKVLLKDPVLYARPIWSLLFWSGFIPADDNKMSKNIYDEFYTWINDPTKPDLGKDVQLNNALVIQGKSSGLSPITSGILIPSSVDKSSDLIVPAKDMQIVCDNIDSTNKYYLSFNGLTHAGPITSTAGKGKVQEQIKFFLKEGRIEPNEKKYQVNQNCELI